MVEDEFRFGNIPAVMFVNVKGMKKVVRKGAVCLDNKIIPLPEGASCVLYSQLCIILTVVYYTLALRVSSLISLDYDIHSFYQTV